MGRPKGKEAGPTRKNMGDVAGAEIRRVWGDLPVTDAEHDLRVFMAPEDVAGAVRKDPADCVFARACRRTFHATKVLFFRTVAYVELPDAKGRRKVERFMLGEDMRALIEQFDVGKRVIPEAGFLLRAPAGQDRLRTRRNRDQRLEAARKARCKLMGQARDAKGAPAPPARGTFKDDPLFVDLAVRSGTGAVRFASKPTPGAGDGPPAG